MANTSGASLPLKLTHVEVMVEPTLRQQSLVRPPLDNLAVVDDQDSIGLADRAQPMGDHEARTLPPPSAAEGLLNMALGPRVNAAGCLVQDQDTRIRQGTRAIASSCRCPWLRLLPFSKAPYGSHAAICE